MISALLFADGTETWNCSSDSDCPEATTCISEICTMAKEKVVEYATINIAAGENSPSSGGSDRIFVTHPANDLVLGQLAIQTYSGEGENKFYFVKEISSDISVYPTPLKFENFKLVYDANGNGIADPSEKVVATGEITGYTVKFKIEQNLTAYKVNQPTNFLIIGSFSTENKMSDLAQFNASVRTDYIKTKTYLGEGAIAATPAVKFSYFSFEPEEGYFLFSSGNRFPSAPKWQEINKEHEIMHIKLKALDGANELNALKINLYGSAVAFGNGVNKISLYIDSNNDGKGDTIISELSDFTELKQSAYFQIPAGKISLGEGNETYLTVKADLNFYKDQNTYFYITENDVILKTKQKIAGTPVKTENFKYSCKEDDPECRLKPEEEKEEGDSGCSLLFVD